MTTFQSLGLSEPILKAIEETGYETPTPIQLQGIPAVLAAKDVLGIAQTGTGKTAAFALPILHRLAADRKPTPTRGARVLVLSPTRELASQIADSFRAYGKHLGMSVVVVFGGVSERPQAEKLRRGIDILVATPGRLLDHISQRNTSLAQTEIFVLDEADQMLDLGFFKPIRRIVAELPKQRQSLFFSATMPKEIEELTRELLSDPVKVEVAPASTTVERVTQRVIRIEQSKKKALLAELLSDNAMQRTLVFTRTKRGADRVAKHLLSSKIEAAAIHGNKSQSQREAALHAFKAGRTRVLVATDIAARGIDIDEVSHVVNFELPEVPEAYVHRIGRTARAGASGSAISFCDEGERHLLRDIERTTRQTIEAEDRRGDEKLVGDKTAGKDARETGEPRDGERPSQARREFKKQMGRGEGRFDRVSRERGTGDRPERGDRPARPPRRDGASGSWQSRNRDGDRPQGDRPRGDRPRGDRPQGDRPRGDRPHGDRPFGDRPRRDATSREGGEKREGVWTNDGSRPDRQHRSEQGRGEFRREGRPQGDRGPREARGAGGSERGSFRDRGERRPDRDARGEGRREDRPPQNRGEGRGPAGERRERSFDGPRGGDRHGDRGPRREDRPHQARGENSRPDGERREWRPRPPRDDSRGEGRGPRPEGRRPEGGDRAGGERSGGWRGPRRDGPPREGRSFGDKPRPQGRSEGGRSEGGRSEGGRSEGGRSEGGRSEAGRGGAGAGGLKRPSGPRQGTGPRQGGFRGRDDKRPRRDAEGQ